MPLRNLTVHRGFWLHISVGNFGRCSVIIRRSSAVVGRVPAEIAARALSAVSVGSAHSSAEAAVTAKSSAEAVSVSSVADNSLGGSER